MGNTLILIVEDDAIIAENIRRKLASAGYIIPNLVMSGEKAIEKAEEVHPNLVLMDIGLSGKMDGVEAARQIRNRCDIPVVYLTAHTDEATLQRAKLTEPFGYVSKPFEISELRSIIETALYKHQLEQKLKEREAHFRLLYEEAPLAYQSLNEDGCLLEVNQAWLHLLGYERDEVIGRWFGDFLTPEEVSLFKERFPRFKVAGVTRNVEFEMVCKDNTRLIVSIDGRIGYDEAGHFQQTHCILLDITARKQAEQALAESEALHRITMENILDPVFITDDTGRFTFICANVVHTLGYSIEEIEAMGNISKLIGDSLPSPKELDALGQITNVERNINDKSGQTRHYLINIKRVSIKEGTVLYTCHNITERKQAEMALQQRHRQLELLNLAAYAFNTSLALEQVLGAILEETRHLLTVTACSVWLVDPATDELVCRQAAGPQSEIVQGWRLAPGEGIAGATVTGGQSLIVPDVCTDARYFQGVDEQTGLALRSILSVPLQTKGQVIGVLQAVDTAVNRFTSDDLTLLESLANSAAIAIDNARLFEAINSGRRRLQLLSKRLVETQENERRRIARELHDVVGQALTAVKINLQSAQHALGAAAEPETNLAQDLAGVIDTVEQTLQEVRKLSFDLRPSLLDDLGLAPALRWYLDRQAQQAGLVAQFMADPLDRRLPAHLEVACFRIAQEALTNVVRHAQAKQVNIELRQLDAELQLIIRDDGVGFDVAPTLQQAKTGESLGLLGMQERAQLVGGQLEIESAPNHGTEICLRAPLMVSTPETANTGEESL